MIRLIIVCEGESEETFVRDILTEIFALNSIYVSAQMIPSSPMQKGGALTYERVKRHIERLLMGDNDIYVTTFFDLYAIDKNFPKIEEGLKIQNLYEKVAFIEKAFLEDLSNDLQRRFIPYIQAYEFEALIFSDIEKLIEVEEWDNSAKNRLITIRDEFQTPEHINNSKHTAPSIRIKNILKSPKYRKVIHSSLALEMIGIDKILEECKHFSKWYFSLLELNNEV